MGAPARRPHAWEERAYGCVPASVRDDHEQTALATGSGRDRGAGLRVLELMEGMAMISCMLNSHVHFVRCLLGQAANSVVKEEGQVWGWPSSSSGR